MKKSETTDLVDLGPAIALLNTGDVVAMPTETVYGLAARIDSETGLKKIFSVKQRPFFDPLIVHVASLEQARSCASDWNAMNQLLAEKFWPGPLTQVMPKSEKISDLITSGLTSVGLRWPGHPLAQRLIREAGVPLAAPSANKFGRTSPTRAQHVRDEFGESVYVVDGDVSRGGIESTVLSVKKNQDVYELCVLRRGLIVASQITEALKGAGLAYRWVEQINPKESPGHLQHHYMPSIPFVICRNPATKLSQLAQQLNLRLAELPDEVEGVKIIKPRGEIKQIEFLKLSTDAEIAARELYSQLRSASQRGPEALCFIQLPVHSGELWESLLDRLYKAASLVLD
jgi:L-threonylcarbamoyladenylate synthase